MTTFQQATEPSESDSEPEAEKPTPSVGLPPRKSAGASVLDQFLDGDEDSDEGDEGDDDAEAEEQARKKLKAEKDAALLESLKKHGYSGVTTVKISEQAPKVPLVLEGHILIDPLLCFIGDIIQGHFMPGPKEEDPEQVREAALKKIREDEAKMREQEIAADKKRIELTVRMFNSKRAGETTRQKNKRKEALGQAKFTLKSHRDFGEHNSFDG